MSTVIIINIITFLSVAGRWQTKIHGCQSSDRLHRGRVDGKWMTGKGGPCKKRTIVGKCRNTTVNTAVECIVVYVIVPAKRNDIGVMIVTYATTVSLSVVCGSAVL